MVAWAEGAPWQEAKAIGEALRSALDDECAPVVLMAMCDQFIDFAETIRKRIGEHMGKVEVGDEVGEVVHPSSDTGHCQGCGGTGYITQDAPLKIHFANERDLIRRAERDVVVRCVTCAVFATDREAFQCWIENELTPLYKRYASQKTKVKKASSKGVLKNELDAVYILLDSAYQVYRRTIAHLRARGE